MSSEPEILEGPPADLEFPAAPPDMVARLLGLVTYGLLALLEIGSVLGMLRAISDDAWGDMPRLAGFAVLGVVVAALVHGRAPVRYRVSRDPDYGYLLSIDRAVFFRPVRLRLDLYEEAVRVHRVVFSWMPLLSGTRLFGLRGGRFEEMILGFWSFGRNGSRAVVLTGPGRPRTLISPRDPTAFLRGLAGLPDLGPIGLGPGEGDQEGGPR